MKLCTRTRSRYGRSKIWTASNPFAFGIISRNESHFADKTGAVRLNSPCDYYEALIRSLSGVSCERRNVRKFTFTGFSLLYLKREREREKRRGLDVHAAEAPPPLGVPCCRHPVSLCLATSKRIACEYLDFALYFNAWLWQFSSSTRPVDRYRAASQPPLLFSPLSSKISANFRPPPDRGRGLVIFTDMNIIVMTRINRTSGELLII